ncbi:MAG: energy-coupling factor transporter transmembrane component T [Syntrophomonadaceae bacterium]|nr:energy-coupling factor transporter transmembrane component T [Syntrophomonadaceae bacterium]
MKVDPRSKMLIVICISGLALIYNQPLQLALLLSASLTMLVAFRFDMGVVGGYLRPLVSLLLILFLIQCLFTKGGQAWLMIGQLELVSSAGVIAGASVVLRILVVVTSALLLTTCGSRDFVLGLIQWKVPYEIAFMVSIALRFLPLFRDELQNVITAVQLRGVDLKKIAWGEKISMYRTLAFPVVYRTMLKAQQLSIVMEARGFRAYPRRTYLRRLDLCWADYVIISLALTVTAILLGGQIL